MLIRTISFICLFIIVRTMVGYPLFLLLLDKLIKAPQINKSYDYNPSVTILVVAHNEEKVIWEKLINLINLDYSKDKIKIIVTSDYSTDKTNELVEKFIKEYKGYNVFLYKTRKHGGKTNAQNEAVRLIDTDLIVMTDANCIFKEDAVKEISACFFDDEIKYVCGSTVYTNADTNRTANSESVYWDLDTKCRDIEGRIQSITAGDGNIYACRTRDYKFIPPIECHDSSFPVLFSLENNRAVFNPKSIAYEKAGENDKDEYKRKVRMNRNILHNILPSVKILNFVKYRWFSFFWISHRTFRYLLWLAHFILFLLSGLLAFYRTFWLIAFLVQIAFYLLALVGIVTKSHNKLIKLISYYVMTIAAQWKGVYNIISGKRKATRAKAESTR
ncbi:glycosyltransferase [Anaerococcus tetradius]|nr:glycosyltransferase [Anaerococcus tetradius]